VFLIPFSPDTTPNAIFGRRLGELSGYHHQIISTLQTFVKTIQAGSIGKIIEVAEVTNIWLDVLAV
jgi:hypothetical protein